MSHFHLRLSVADLPCNHVPNVLLWRTLGYVAEYTLLRKQLVRSNYHTYVTKNISSSCAPVSSFPQLHHFGALQVGADVGETSDVYFHSKFDLDSAEKNALNDEVQLDSCHEAPESLSDDKERPTSKKTKHGNKGRVPWNKGRKHTAETHALIKQRTVEALRDPQVRKKMSEHPHAHSDEDKAKISSSLRQLWGKRLKWKRLRERFFLSWAKSIAKAAKEGGTDQEELDWDSYDKIKQEIALQQLQSAMDMTKAKDLLEIERAERAERATQTKAKKMERLAQKRKMWEEKVKAREGAKRKAYSKSKKNAQELPVAQELTLKRRLTKIRKKKSTNVQVSTQGEALISASPAWEKLDIELIKREKLQREVSLADRIQAAKNKRTESMAREALAASSTDHLFTGRLVNPKFHHMQQP